MSSYQLPEMYTGDQIEVLPGLIFDRCDFQAMGRRCCQICPHEGLHRLVAERTLHRERGL